MTDFSGRCSSIGAVKWEGETNAETSALSFGSSNLKSCRTAVGRLWGLELSDSESWSGFLMTRFHGALLKHGSMESQQIKLLNSSAALSTQRSDSWFDWL